MFYNMFLLFCLSEACSSVVCNLGNQVLSSMSILVVVIVVCCSTQSNEWVKNPSHNAETQLSKLFPKYLWVPVILSYNCREHWLKTNMALERGITQSVSQRLSARAQVCVTGIHGNGIHEVYGLATALGGKILAHEKTFSFWSVST